MRYFAVLIILAAFWPATQVSAQVGRNYDPVPTFICVKQDGTDVKYPYQEGAPCPNGYSKIKVVNTVSVPFIGVCVDKTTTPPNVTEPNRPSNTDPSGQISCDEGVLFAKNTIQTAGPPNNNSNGNNNGNSNSGGNNNSNSGTPPSQGVCESGFHEVGPLCLPNSPFSGSGGVAGATTLGDLVVKVISILLFIAGIVAVIMSIIGGYYIMTAAGNPTQAANGRKTLVNAIIGLVIVVMSYVVIQVIVNFITK